MLSAQLAHQRGRTCRRSHCVIRLRTPPCIPLELLTCESDHHQNFLMKEKTKSPAPSAGRDRAKCVYERAEQKLARTTAGAGRRLLHRFSKQYPLNHRASAVASSASNAFQRWTTGMALITAIPSRMRSFSSSFDFTRICRRKVRVILPNKVSTMLSQEPCVGVSTYLKRLGRVARYARVSLEICAE